MEQIRSIEEPTVDTAELRRKIIEGEQLSQPELDFLRQLVEEEFPLQETTDA